MPTVAAELLLQYFDRLFPLKDYLTATILYPEAPEASEFLPKFIPTDADSQEYHELVNSTIVALTPLNASTLTRRFEPHPPMTHMSEIIDRAHEKLFTGTSKANPPKNVLTQGYRLAKNNDNACKITGSIGVTNTHVNTLVTALQSSSWESLLQRIGIDAMFHLLTETSIFVSLPNDCLCQLTGESIMFIKATIKQAPGAAKRKVTSAVINGPPTKKRKLEGGKSLSRSGSFNAHPKAAVMFVNFQEWRSRHRIFYGRISHVPGSTRTAIGFRPDHILNRFFPSYDRTPVPSPEEYVEPDPIKAEADTILLAKHVFSRQYSLTSPFDADPNRPEAGRMFEEEIERLGRCKTPKRLKVVLPMLNKLIWRHSKCAYMPLLDLACPSKVKQSNDIANDSSVILEIMSETVSQPYLTQASLVSISDESMDRSAIHRNLSQAVKQGKNAPRFFEFTCSYYEVYRYAALVTKAVIPKAFWGCDKNYKLVLHHIRQFIECRRHETLSLHHVLQGMSTSECSWLSPLGEKVRAAGRVDVSDSLKRLQLLQDFVYWYFDSFLMPLIKTNFFVTESSALKNKVLYFRQDDWDILCAPLIERLTDSTFKKIPEHETEEITHQRGLGYSYVRLLPKETGVRPIVNLKRTKKDPTNSNRHKSINQILQASFQILTYEKNRQPERMGASACSVDDIFSMLKTFKSSLKRDVNGNLPKMYFVKLDVKACFDTIEQGKLLTILQDLISEDSYIIQRFGQINPVRRKPTKKWKKSAIPEDEQSHFLVHAAELAASLRHVIFSDQVTYGRQTKATLLQLLQEHITENIVKIGQAYYRQMVGIPQGSVLSSILCWFCYGDMERRYMNYSQDPECTMSRWMDDYLFITTNLQKAREFLSMMNKGHPEYGCFISPEKTVTNFDHNEDVMSVLGSEYHSIPWCGYLINMKDLSVAVDYSRYAATAPTNGLTVNRGRNPGVAFTNKMLANAALRAHIIYNDSHLNGDDGTYLNIYQNFILSAIKMQCYLKTWKIDLEKQKCASFIFETICQMGSYTFASILSKSKSKAAQKLEASAKVDRTSVLWLGFHAFRRVLAKQRERFHIVLRRLELELRRSKYKRVGRRFGRIVRDGVKVNGMAGVYGW